MGVSPEAEFSIHWDWLPLLFFGNLVGGLDNLLSRSDSEIETLGVRFDQSHIQLQTFVVFLCLIGFGERWAFAHRFCRIYRHRHKSEGFDPGSE